MNAQDAERYAKELGGRLLSEKETTDIGLRGFGGGVLLEKELSINPAKLIPNMTNRLAEMGVQFERSGQSRLITENGTVKAVEADGKRLAGDSFVVTAGARCRDVLRPLGFDPMVLPARGMVMIFDTKGEKLFDHGILFEDHGIGLVQHNPTTLRLTSFFELTGFKETWGESRKKWLLQTTEKHVSEFGRLKCVEEGMGYRPCTPDQLPVLGAVPGYANLFVASGNCRLGLTLAPVTGYVTASLIRGEEPHDQPWHYFEASRFGRSHRSR
jgi:glycine/D-amino acid oxidase-like deaminating enzyme